MSLFSLIDLVLSAVTWLLIASAVVSWLIAFNVINTRNQFAYTIADTLYRVTEPILRPVRRFIPNLGGIDISPVIVILAIIFIRNLLREYGLVF
jgi:YggT family protein